MEGGMKSYKKGKVYKIRFYDHFASHKDIVECTLVGFFYKEDKKSITLAHWISHCEDPEDADHNIEVVTLVKSCIISVRELK